MTKYKCPKSKKNDCDGVASDDGILFDTDSDGHELPDGMLQCPKCDIRFHKHQAP